jgi:hypothetical protein
MKAPRFATITVSVDTERHALIRPEVREHHLNYLLDRLLSGKEVAESEFVHLGMKVSVREAVKPEIL